VTNSRVLARMAPVVFLALAVAATAQGQERGWTVKAPSQECGAGAVVVGSLGYSGIECSSCSFTLHADGSDRQWKFRAEPVITGVKSGGPADGKLREGDVVVAIGGYLITTQEGGRLFGSITPGEPVVLRIRRDGREAEVAITPAAECARIQAPAAPAPAAQPAMPAPAAAPTPVMVAEPLAVAVPVPPMPLGGRLGMSIECSDCSVKVPEDAKRGEGGAVWTFRTAPRIERVEVDGPAAKAGLRGGDELTHIDGVALTSEDGGRRFGAVQPGDTVVLRYRRNAADTDAVLVAAPQEWVVLAPKAGPALTRGERVVAARAPVPVEETTRFSGVLGETQVMVTGGPITVTRTETEIVIRSQDIVVRVRQVVPPPPKE
jgi:hypothetical protein